MSTTSQISDPFVVLYGIPWESYERILDALGEYHLRHTYIDGTLELRGVLYGVTWEDYQKFLDALADYPLRHTFAEGTLEMMSPRKDHDWIKKFIGRIIEFTAYGLEIEIQCIGSTTLTAQNLARGFQPDEAYYIANESIVRGKSTYDPGIDPPPDLLVEVDVTSSSVPRMAGFADIGIPEVWRYDGERTMVLKLVADGQYEEVDRSVSFPFIAPGDIDAHLDLLADKSEREILNDVVAIAKSQK